MIQIKLMSFLYKIELQQLQHTDTDCSISRNSAIDSFPFSRMGATIGFNYQLPITAGHCCIMAWPLGVRHSTYLSTRTKWHQSHPGGID